MTLVEINPHSMMSYEWTGVLGQGPPALLLACLGLNLAMIQIRGADTIPCPRSHSG